MQKALDSWLPEHTLPLHSVISLPRSKMGDECKQLKSVYQAVAGDLGLSTEIPNLTTPYHFLGKSLSAKEVSKIYCYRKIQI